MDIDQRLDRLKERSDALLCMIEPFIAWKRASLERLGPMLSPNNVDHRLTGIESGLR
jgi:hypothetical protein